MINMTFIREIKTSFPLCASPYSFQKLVISKVLENIYMVFGKEIVQIQIVAKQLKAGM